MSLNKIRKLLIYGIITFFCFVIDYSISKLSFYIGSYIVISNSIGWIIGAISHYLLSKSIVFESKKKFNPIVLFLYLFNLLFNNLIVSLLYNSNIEFLICKVIAASIIFISNFYILNIYFKS